MNDYQIEKDIPLKATTHATAAWKKFPFAKMGSGDSFFVPRNPSKKLRAHVQQMQSNAQAAARATGFKFAVRQISDDDQQGARIWRTK